MSFLGKLFYKLYFAPIGKRKTIRNYGGKEKYKEMIESEREMKHYALNHLEISKFFTSEGKYKLNFLTGEKFIHQSLFCVYSFFKHISDAEAAEFSVSFFDDKTLSKETIELVRKKFNNIVIVPYSESKKAIAENFPLNTFPWINKKSKEYVYFNKIFFVQNRPGLKIFLDSDMLFIKKPHDFLLWLENNYGDINSTCVMEDIKQSYGYAESILTKVNGKKVDHKLNSGFYGIHTEAINFEKLENQIKELEENYGPSYFMEQFITSIFLNDQKNLTVFKRDQYIVWPSKDDVEREIGVLHHYVGTSKYDYFTKAWRKLLIS